MSILRLLATSVAFIGLTHAEQQVKVYFGAGCFWHIQHVFIAAEERILQRKGVNLTALAGYAGHTAKGTACYMDEKVSAEVVGMEVPQTSLSKFALAYFDTFVGMDRSHANDRGPHYRAVIGLPGGLSSPFFANISSASTKVNFQFKEGTGDDSDTLGQALIWVYDSSQFPFHQAEIYHQFRDDYLPGGDYSVAYNSLAVTLACHQALKPTGCFNDGIGSIRSCAPNIMTVNFSVTETAKEGSSSSASSLPRGGSGDLALPSSGSSVTTPPTGTSASRSGSSFAGGALLTISMLWAYTL